MKVCLEKSNLELIRRVLKLASELNEMSHNETTWEKKQFGIEQALETVVMALDLGQEVDVDGLFELTKSSQAIAERAMSRV